MWRPGRRPGGSPGRKGALRTSVDPGPIVSTLTGSGFGLLIYVARKLRIYADPKRLRTKYPQANPRASGASFGALPYVTRRPLRIFFRPKHILVDVQPVRQLLVIGDPRRIKRVSWHVNAARFAILSPPVAVLRKPLRTIRFKQKRPLWRFFRPRHVLGYTPPAPPPQSSIGAGVNSYALPYVSRRLRSYYRPRHVLPQPRPVAISWKRPVTVRYRPRRLSRWNFKHKYIYGVFPPPISPPQSASAFGALSYVSRRLRIFGRPKHIISLKFAGPVYRPYRAPLRLKQQRPLWRFYRPRHVLGYVPDLPTSFFPRKPGPRPRIKRLRWNNLSTKRRMLYFPKQPPTPPSAAEWIIRYRRRGRR